MFRWKTEFVKVAPPVTHMCPPIAEHKYSVWSVTWNCGHCEDTNGKAYTLNIQFKLNLTETWSTGKARIFLETQVNGW